MRHTLTLTHSHSMHDQHAVCSSQTEQVDVEHINQADYLNVTEQHLVSSDSTQTGTSYSRQ